MQRSIFENLGLAGLALILSFLVWIGATFEENPPTTRRFASPIPIEVINRPQGWIVRNQSAEQVRVEVRGREDALTRLTVNSFRAVANLSGLGDGLHEVPVEVALGDRSVTIVSRDPPSISLMLDRQEEKTLAVQVSVIDLETVPLGYSARPPTVEPKEVKVVGPKALVDRVSNATVSVLVQGSKTTVERKPTVRLSDEAGNTVEGLRAEPNSVAVQVPIEQDVGFRDVTVRAIVTGSPAPGYWVSNILVQPPTLTIFGLPSTLAQIGGFLETAPIDITDARADLVKRVPLNLPSGISLLSEEGQQAVQVTVQISAIVGGQTIQREVAFQGLSLGLKATVSPTTVDVILSGPVPVLQELNPEDVRIVVDLFGLTVGTHKVPGRAVLVPEGLQVVSIVPDVVEVIIELGP